MPAVGFTRLRSLQSGRQTVFGTAVAATSVIPLRGSPDLNPNWQVPDVDVGTFDRGMPLFRTSSDVTGQYEGPADYDNMHKYLAAALKNGVTSTGTTARTWVFQSSATSDDGFEYFTHEWGDEVASDQVQLVDGIIERLELTLPEDLGPVVVNAQYRYSKHTYPSAKTGGLTANSSNFHQIYAADAEVYINSTAATIGTTKLSDVVRGGSIVIENTVDLKRYANGSNTRFQVGAYGRSARRVSANLRLEKQASATAEVVNFLASTAVDRFLEVRFTSPDIITGTTPYSFSVRLPGNWINRGNGEIGGNAVLDLELDGYADSALGYPLRAVVVNGRSNFA